MKRFLILTAFAIESLCASTPSIQSPEMNSPVKIKGKEKSSYVYAKISDQWIFFPGVGVGFRSHNPNSKHGINMGISGYLYGDGGSYALSGNVHYLFYPTKEHFYFGIGGGINGGWMEGGGCGLFGYRPSLYFVEPAVEGICGYEWNTEKIPVFLQFEIGKGQKELVLYPNLSLGVGF